MRTISQLTRLTVAIAALAGVAACADAPNAPVTATPNAAVAASFEAMAQQEALAGAIDRSEDWRWVAKAIRQGVEPSRIEIWTYGKMEEYKAFVRAIEGVEVMGSARRSPGHTMLAWQQKEGGPLVDHVARLFSPGDRGSIVPPIGIDNETLRGARLEYVELDEDESPWIGLKGFAQVEERWAGGPCYTALPPELEKLPGGVKCQKATFNVRFEAICRPMRGDVFPLSTMNMWMREQKVIGVKFTPGN